jgi:hypothetical protein
MKERTLLNIQRKAGLKWEGKRKDILRRLSTPIDIFTD